MTRKPVDLLLSAASAVAPKSIRLLAQQRYYENDRSIGLKRLREYARAGIHLGSREFNILQAAGLLDVLDEELIQETRAYHQKAVGKTLDPIVNVACNNLHKVADTRFLSRSFYWFHVIPYLNDMTQHETYTEKNLYTKHLPPSIQPVAILKNINGAYFDRSDKPLRASLLKSYLEDCEGEFIIKPSRTANGVKINALARQKERLWLSGQEKTWEDIERVYGSNFIVQEKIHQHEVMAEPHPGSVNTLRILTLRWDARTHLLAVFARFGSDGAVNDNAGTGGLCIGVDRQGQLADFAVNARAQRVHCHPSTGYEFSQRKTVPGFEAATALCLALHDEILHHNLVSWDIAIDSTGKPVFIEHNFKGALWLYQLTTGTPVLGDWTDDVLAAIRARNRW